MCVCVCVRAVRAVSRRFRDDDLGHGSATDGRTGIGKRRRILVEPQDQIDRGVPDDRGHAAHHIQIGLVLVGEDGLQVVGQVVVVGQVGGGGRRVRTAAPGRRPEPDAQGLESDGPQQVRLVSRYLSRLAPTGCRSVLPRPGSTGDDVRKSGAFSPVRRGRRKYVRKGNKKP